MFRASRPGDALIAVGIQLLLIAAALTVLNLAIGTYEKYMRRLMAAAHRSFRSIMNDRDPRAYPDFDDTLRAAQERAERCRANTEAAELLQFRILLRRRVELPSRQDW
jgi:hypothetical protein